jgi:hypothetical protein
MTFLQHLIVFIERNSLLLSWQSGCRVKDDFLFEAEAGYCDILRDVTQHVGEITHPADGVISSPTSKPLIVLVFDLLSRSAQGLP